MDNSHPAYLYTASVPRDYSLADALYERLEKSIERERESLEADEILLVTVAVPGGKVLVVDSIGYHNPHLMRFYGRDEDGNTATALIHMSSVLVLVQHLKKSSVRDPKPPRRIGFLANRELTAPDEPNAPSE